MIYVVSPSERRQETPETQLGRCQVCLKGLLAGMRDRERSLGSYPGKFKTFKKTHIKLDGMRLSATEYQVNEWTTF